ncbi:hypothetical protein MO973_09640 [Paenibacillus sp. TRM 82003]|uniref:hypothetical protein n=1 Tax=Kineococcus sp. TRM81007 TaxID=2925831 RepID=UPI001F5913CF|nr:hypothetical protein [Kineococcus sp. TRM81007]MCI2238109.1 hypothetical protein [Kineococcus sp. TRM81007]MCI3920494.1 hypothetical protein [Paenibacillus sp. TRM 82003]
MVARVIQLRPGAPPDGPRELTDADVAAVYARRADTSRTRTTHRPARRRLIAAGAAIVVGLTTAVLAFQTDDNTPRLPAPAPSASADSSERELRWQQIDGVWFPVSPVAGPTTLDNERAAGFADSDLGAALAAVHLVYRASAAPGPSSFDIALREQVAGPAAAQLTESVRRDYDEARRTAGLAEGEPLPPGAATFLGYRVSALPDGNRAVQIVEQAPDANGVLQPFAFDVVMTRVRSTTASTTVEDWKVVAPSTGTWSAAFSQLPNVPEDMVPFSPSAPTASLGVR